MANPLFPLDEYIPDGEPHVFGDRVYLYGSHDEANGQRFCTQDYTVYSAPIDNLKEWTNHGISYRKDQDPRSNKDKPVDYYAPDCVKGNDGRYYLYYVAMGPNVKPFGPISVAVSDAPQGPFEYLGDVCDQDGKVMQSYLTNDPAVLNDNGRIYLYYGWGLGRDFRSKLLAPLYNLVQSKLFMRSIKEIKTTKPSILSCAVAELQEDMLTIKEGPKAVLDSKTTADQNSELYHHAFYEAPSIRKFNNLYYLVYSSNENYELAYATSQYPDRDFKYRGVIISNADLGYQGNRKAKMAGGTIHGGIENIDGQYYVFYHRCTNNTDFSRQACAERIEIDETGKIQQVEITTQGTEQELLKAKRVWPAALCCNLYNDRTGHVQGNGSNHKRPTIVNEENQIFITAIDHNTVIGYKYLDFENATHVRITYRGSEGKLYVLTDEKCLDLAKKERQPSLPFIELKQSEQWTEIITTIQLPEKGPLFFLYQGTGKVDFLEFELF